MASVSHRTLEHYVTVLTAGLDGLRKLDEHAEKHAGIPVVTRGVEVCVDCMRYAVSVSLQRRCPQDVIGQRCHNAQVWQRQVWAAYALLDSIVRN